MPKATKSSAQVDAQASSQQEAHETSQEELMKAQTKKLTQKSHLTPLDNHK